MNCGNNWTRFEPTSNDCVQLLRSISEVSEGKFGLTSEELFDRGTEVAFRPTPLWPYLLAAALLLFVLDVALRRIDFSLHWPFAQLAASAWQTPTADRAD